MSDFTVIETQEQLDAIIGERLRRERETAAKRFEGWISPEDHAEALKKLEDAAAKTQKELEDKDALIAEGTKYKTDLEKTRIALSAGLKIEYADRLRGESPEEWKKDAELLAKDFKASHFTPPIGSPEPSPGGKPSTRDQFAEWMAQNNE